MKPLPRLCLVLAAALLLTPRRLGASPARSPQPHAAAPAAGLLDPIGAWLARMLAPARASLAPKAAPKAGGLPPATSSAQATVSGHRGCIDPNGSPCT